MGLNLLPAVGQAATNYPARLVVRTNATLTVAHSRSQSVLTSRLFAVGWTQLQVLEYNGNPGSSDVQALVGKGITFDTGDFHSLASTC